MKTLKNILALAFLSGILFSCESEDFYQEEDDQQLLEIQDEFSTGETYTPYQEKPR